jgi:predicted nuclease of predicted toxin-antitoxin system
VTRKPKLRFFLDEGVPDAVGRKLLGSGHEVIYLRYATASGSPDQLVCAVAQANEAILVALDGDMKQLAQRHGVGQSRYRKLSLLKLSCREPKAADRVGFALSLIEHEWNFSAGTSDRRIFIEIGDASISTKR